MPLKRLRRVSYAFDSLLGEILLWLLILLLMLWALSVIMTYQVASTIARKPYDELLMEEVRALGKLVRVDGNRINVNFPAAAREVLRADSRDQILFQVLGPKGDLLAGDKEVPWIAPLEGSTTDKVEIRDDEINGEEVRIAYMFLPAGRDRAPLLIQVAETRNKRQALAASIVSGLIVPQFIIVPVAVLLMYLGLSKGITPLQRLQDELRGRMPTDLTAISVQGIPSEIRPLLVALNTVMSRLDENLVAQRRFISDAAHQLKTPLTGLRMQTELALNEPDAGLMRERLQQVAISAERLSHLTQQLLSLARAEAGLSSREGLVTVDLEEVARQCTITWADRALGKGIELAYEGPDTPVNVAGNALLITELLSNLIDNAIKYTPSGGQVTVRVRPDDYPALEVEDTGIGVPEDARAQVFERFYRVLGTGRDGSGLGLAIVKEIAQLHLARVHLAAGAEGRGTCVRTTFRQPFL